MDTEDLIKLILAITTCLGVIAPVFAITVRIALRPITEAMVRLREGGSSADALRSIERQIELLRADVSEVHELREEVARLAEAQEFQLRLTAPVEHDA